MTKLLGLSSLSSFSNICSFICCCFLLIHVLFIIYSFSLHLNRCVSRVSLFGGRVEFKAHMKSLQIFSTCGASWTQNTTCRFLHVAAKVAIKTLTLICTVQQSWCAISHASLWCLFNQKLAWLRYVATRSFLHRKFHNRPAFICVAGWNVEMPETPQEKQRSRFFLWCFRHLEFFPIMMHQLTNKYFLVLKLEWYGFLFQGKWMQHLFF